MNTYLRKFSTRFQKELKQQKINYSLIKNFMYMETSYTVVITKKHCEGRFYKDTENCPLCSAIREQLPNFPLRSVGGSHVTDKDYRIWSFPALYEHGGAVTWNTNTI